MTNEHQSSKKSARYILAATAVATLGGFLFGYDTGVIGGSQLYFTEYFHFTKAEQGWAVSSALYGCLFRTLVAGSVGFFARFSRKNALILSGLLFAISAYRKWYTRVIKCPGYISHNRRYWRGNSLYDSPHVYCRNSTT